MPRVAHLIRQSRPARADTSVHGSHRGDPWTQLVPKSERLRLQVERDQRNDDPNGNDRTGNCTQKKGFPSASLRHADQSFVVHLAVRTLAPTAVGTMSGGPGKGTNLRLVAYLRPWW